MHVVVGLLTFSVMIVSIPAEILASPGSWSHGQLFGVIPVEDFVLRLVNYCFGDEYMYSLCKNLYFS